MGFWGLEIPENVPDLPSPCVTDDTSFDFSHYPLGVDLVVSCVFRHRPGYPALSMSSVQGNQERMSEVELEL